MLNLILLKYKVYNIDIDINIKEFKYYLYSKSLELFFF